MRILLFHCSRIGSRDVRKSTRPKGIVSDTPVQRTFHDALLALVCVEPWDGEDAIAEASSSIVSHLRLIRRDHVVLTPFAHLSNQLAEPGKARVVLDALQKSLTRSTYRVDMLSFGFHKNFGFALSDVSIHGHPGSVAFRRIPLSIEDELVALSRFVGLDKSIQLLESMSARVARHSPNQEQGAV